MRPIVKSTASLVLGLLFSAAVWAATPEELIRPIQDQWAQIKYRTPASQQADQYKALADKAREIVKNNPGKAEPLIWAGIVVSSEAGARSGLAPLGLAKEAKQLFDDALRINDRALNGSAYTSLGTLYAKVPGWPIGFGDKARAEEYFKRALAMNPNGIDPNYFYGEFLMEKGQTAEARRYLETALKAPARPGREVADNGRRQEVKTLLAKLSK